MITTQEIILDSRLRQTIPHILQVEVLVLVHQVLQVAVLEAVLEAVEVLALQVVVADVDKSKK